MRNDGIDVELELNEMLEAHGYDSDAVPLVTRGRIAVGNTVEVVGLREPVDAVVTGVESLRHRSFEAVDCYAHRTIVAAASPLAGCVVRRLQRRTCQLDSVDGKHGQDYGSTVSG